MGGGVGRRLVTPTNPHARASIARSLLSAMADGHRAVPSSTTEEPSAELP